MQYHQFCPISKAAEILGERWNMLILRELIAGARRFTDLQRGVGAISPALLTGRLRELEAQGMVLRRRIPGQRGHEYFPTAACEALEPVLTAIGEWGLIWAKQTILDSDFDVEFLMLYLERAVDPAQLKGRGTVIKFRFTDLSAQKDWWLVVAGDRTEVCLKDPGRDVDVYFHCSVRTMAEVWMGDRTYREAMAAGDLRIEGDPALTRNVRAWLRPNSFAGAPRGPAAPGAAEGDERVAVPQT